jgi:hypothetical protein
MANPNPVVLFFQSPWDLLDKAERDRDRLVKVLARFAESRTEMERIADAAFDSAVTTHSITDWTSKVSGQPEHVRAWREGEVALTLLQDVANGSKHFEFDGKYEKRRRERDAGSVAGAMTTTSIGTASLCSPSDFLSAYVKNAPRKPEPLPAGQTKSRPWVKITAKSGERYDLVQLLDYARELWKGKLAELGVARPQSKAGMVSASTCPS